MLAEIISMIVGDVATAAIKEELGLNPKSIGTGTGAGTQAGPEMEYIPVGEDPEGSSITEFEYQDPSKEVSRSMNEEELMALLSQQDLSQQGILGAAAGGYLKKAKNGGYLKKANGGGIAGNANRRREILDEIISRGRRPRSSSMADTFPEIDLTDPERLEIDLTDPEMDLTNLELMAAPALPDVKPNLLEKGIGTLEGMKSSMTGWWKKLDPETKEKIIKQIGDIGTSLALKAVGLGPVSRTVAPKVFGAMRDRRQIKTTPLQGSQITSYAGGGALNRPMFMPHGGAMRGQGGPKEDLIPVMASNGEYMLSKAAVDQAGSGNHRLGIAKLNAFNNRGNRRYG